MIRSSSIDVEHRERCLRGHRVAAERAEQARRPQRSLHELAARDDRGDRIAVAHRLAEDTKSGVMPRWANDHRCSPLRPWPTCTSSATNRPPASRVASAISPRRAGVGGEDAVAGEPGSMKVAASRCPRSSRRAAAEATAALPASWRDPLDVGGVEALGPLLRREVRHRRRRRRGRRGAVTIAPAPAGAPAAIRHAMSFASLPEFTIMARVEASLGRHRRQRVARRARPAARTDIARWC